MSITAMKQSMELAVDLYSGAGALQLLSAWGRVMADPDAMRELATNFERAYADTMRLQDEGKVYKNTGFSSKEALEAIQRINELIKLGLNNPQTFQHAGEIHTLAEQCLEALKMDSAPKSDSAAEANNEPT